MNNLPLCRKPLALLKAFHRPRSQTSLTRSSASYTDYRTANYRTTNNFGPIAPPSQSTGTLSGGPGGNRRRVNTATSFDLIPDRGTSGREAQRDDAAPRGGVRIANNPFDALADYGSVSTTDSDKGKGSDKALD